MQERQEGGVIRELTEGVPGAAPGVTVPPAGPTRPPFVLAVQGGADDVVERAQGLADRVSSRFPSLDPVILLARVKDGAIALVPPERSRPGGASGGLPIGAPAASQGAVPGTLSPIGAVLREAAERDALGMAIVAAEPHDTEVDWVDRLLGPVIEGGFDLVCPAYRRHRTEGAITTGIVAPLLRALYGRALRQPLGTELAISAGLARKLLEDDDWRRRPAEAGSDAWLLAKTLGSEARVAEAWLGAWPRPVTEPEEPSQALVRALHLVFVEMERSPDRWQRPPEDRPVPIFGTGSYEPPGDGFDVRRLVDAFALGLRDLLPVWNLILPPATLLSLRRIAAAPPGAFEIPDTLWARVIFDFAVGHMTRVVEWRQLLQSLTPLYMGWLAGLVRDASRLDDAGFDARRESLARAFQLEKRYLISRWRWPDDFNP